MRRTFSASKKRVSTNWHRQCNWLRVNYALSYTCAGIIPYVEHCCSAQQERNVAVFRDQLQLAPCNHAEGTVYRRGKGKGKGKGKDDGECPHCTARLSHFRSLHRKPGHKLNVGGGRSSRYSCCRWGRVDGAWDVARLFSRQPVPAATAEDADASALLNIIFHYDGAFGMKAHDRCGTFIQQVLEVRNTLIGHLQKNELDDDASEHGVAVILRFLEELTALTAAKFTDIEQAAGKIRAMKTTGDAFFRHGEGSAQWGSRRHHGRSRGRWAPRPPMVGFDTTGDGVIDAVDTSGDGIPDTKVRMVSRGMPGTASESCLLTRTSSSGRPPLAPPPMPRPRASLASAVGDLKRANDNAKTAEAAAAMPPPPPSADLEIADAPSPPPSVRIGRSLVGRRVAILAPGSSTPGAATAGADAGGGGAAASDGATAEQQQEPLWWRGVVEGHDASTGYHRVRYDGGVARWQLLADATLKVLDADAAEQIVWGNDATAAASPPAMPKRRRSSSAGEMLRRASSWLFGGSTKSEKG